MDDIVISAADLKNPHIDDVLNIERAANQSHGGEFVEDIATPFYYNPIFYYTIAGSLGAFAGWALGEPYLNDNAPDDPQQVFFAYLFFFSITSMISLFIGMTYGISNRNIGQAGYCGIVGMGVGIGATFITSIIAGILFAISAQIAGAMMDGQSPVDPDGRFAIKGVPFFILVCGRGATWSVLSMGIGLGLGVALKSKKLILNGLAGGMVGGVLGGLFFDPINRFITPYATEVWLSRCVGVVAVGTFVGLFIGLFENISKDSWFSMLKGPLAGKQFNLFKSPMVIGSAPKCDIYLFKDPAIEPKHAMVVKSGNKYLMQAHQNNKVEVNNRPVDKYILQSGDVVAIGSTVLKYHERERK